LDALQGEKSASWRTVVRGATLCTLRLLQLNANST
jgi:hypothetical protein